MSGDHVYADRTEFSLKISAPPYKTLYVYIDRRTFIYTLHYVLLYACKPRLYSLRGSNFFFLLLFCSFFFLLYVFPPLTLSLHRAPLSLVHVGVQPDVSTNVHTHRRRRLQPSYTLTKGAVRKLPPILPSPPLRQPPTNGPGNLVCSRAPVHYADITARSDKLPSAFRCRNSVVRVVLHLWRHRVNRAREGDTQTRRQTARKKQYVGSGRRLT